MMLYWSDSRRRSFDSYSVEKNIQYLVSHGRQFVATPGDDPVCGHFIEGAKQNLGHHFRVQFLAKHSRGLPLFESGADQTEVFGETRSGKLFHELRRTAQLYLKNHGQVAIGAQAFQMQPGYAA